MVACLEALNDLLKTFLTFVTDGRSVVGGLILGIAAACFFIKLIRPSDVKASEHLIDRLEKELKECKNELRLKDRRIEKCHKKLEELKVKGVEA